jgi:hypothetical protein
MPRVAFEPTIPVFERAKTAHALDHATTVFGTSDSTILKKNDHNCHFKRFLLRPEMWFITIFTSLYEGYRLVTELQQV